MRTGRFTGDDRPGLMSMFDAAADDVRDQHLPADRAEGLAYFQQLLDRYHAAVLANDEDAVDALKDEGDRLALKMNGGPGFLADEDAAGRWLERETKAPTGTIPRWGQRGSFILTLPLGAWSVRVRIDAGGLWGYGFSTHAVDWHLPFISETGYRSFNECVNWGPVPVDAYVREKITAYFHGESRSKLKTIRDDDQRQHRQETTDGTREPSQETRKRTAHALPRAHRRGAA